MIPDTHTFNSDKLDYEGSILAYTEDDKVYEVYEEDAVTLGNAWGLRISYDSEGAPFLKFHRVIYNLNLPTLEDLGLDIKFMFYAKKQTANPDPSTAENFISSHIIIASVPKLKSNQASTQSIKQLTFNF